MLVDIRTLWNSFDFKDGPKRKPWSSSVSLERKSAYLMDKGLPPPGGDQNKAAKTITIWAVLISLSVLTVTVRFVARAVGNKRFGWDDWTMLAALVRFLLTKNTTDFPGNLL